MTIRTSRRPHGLRRRIHPIAGVWALMLVLASSIAVPASAEALDLEGAWYVLVHYQDSNSPHPDQARWEDKVWVFTRKGARLGWSEYPIAVFDDETGRFERRSTGQYARILHYWEPNPAQLEDIANGLQVNNRGSKKKTLRGADAKGWTSGRSTGAASASIVTYEEVWTIEGMPTQPIFARSDFMGGGRTDTMEGRTEYAATEVLGDREIRGRYARDGIRHGTFRMLRSAPVGALKSKKTQAEIQQQGFVRSIETNPEIRAQVSEEIELALRQAGLSLSDAELETLTSESVRWASQGVPEPQIKQRIGERAAELAFGFAPGGATHDDAVRYRWPFEAATPRVLLLGPDAKPAPGMPRHKSLEQAYWFGLDAGTPVVAARAGVVQRIVDGFPEGGRDSSQATKSNLVVVVHDDGTYAVYGHLQRGISLEHGQRVAPGDRIGLSGSSGQVTEPSLLFVVQRADSGGTLHSVRIDFSGGPRGLATGTRYGGAAPE